MRPGSSLFTPGLLKPDEWKRPPPVSPGDDRRTGIPVPGGNV